MAPADVRLRRGKMGPVGYLVTSVRAWRVVGASALILLLCSLGCQAVAAGQVAAPQAAQWINQRESEWEQGTASVADPERRASIGIARPYLADAWQVEELRSELASKPRD